MDRRMFLGAVGGLVATSALQPGCATAGLAEGELPPSTGPEQTDDPSLKVRFLACRSKEPINAVIMEACGRPGHKFDGLSISHSTADRVKEIFSTILKPGKSAYRPSSPGQPVYLTHVGYGDWGTNTFDEALGPGFKVASDGQEIEVRPLS